MNPNYSQQWYFKKEDLLRTPSIHSGYTYEQEKIDRAKGCSFILTVGMTLKLPQVTLATATVFLHRFYMRRSLKEYNYYDIGATCIFLATKVEETGRKMKDIVVTVAAKASKKDDMQLPEGSKEYNKWRDTILFLEEVLLEAICFDLTIEHPYGCLLKISGKIEGSRKLAQTAWAFINDSLRTPLCVIHKPHVIAAAALYLAAKLTNPELIATDSDTDMVGNEKSNNIVGSWWNHVDASIHDIEEVSIEILDQYSAMAPAGKTVTAPTKPSSEYRPNTPNNPTSPQTQLNTPSYYSDGGSGTTAAVGNGNGNGNTHGLAQGVRMEQ